MTADMSDISDDQPIDLSMPSSVASSGSSPMVPDSINEKSSIAFESPSMRFSRFSSPFSSKEDGVAASPKTPAAPTKSRSELISDAEITPETICSPRLKTTPDFLHVKTGESLFTTPISRREETERAQFSCGSSQGRTCDSRKRKYPFAEDSRNSVPSLRPESLNSVTSLRPESFDEVPSFPYKNNEDIYGNILKYKYLQGLIQLGQMQNMDYAATAPIETVSFFFYTF